MFIPNPNNYNIKKQKNKPLLFVHTPKCGGTYTASILSYLKIKNIGHTQMSIDDNVISFTIIRNPIERFESLLNFRLGQKIAGTDWPKHLNFLYENNSTMTLNEIVSSMSDQEICGFSPYKTLTFWTKNIDVIITIEELPLFLKSFGYTYDESLFPTKNVSLKSRGKFNEQTIERIKFIFKDDINLFNKTKPNYFKN